MPSHKIYDTEKFPDLFSEKQVRVFQIQGDKYCVAKHGEQYFAFEYLCPHQKQPLTTAKITSFGEVVCPLHEYRFSLQFGNEANHKCNALKTYKLHMKPEGVYLEF